jgi:hypothetical protein
MFDNIPFSGFDLCHSYLLYTLRQIHCCFDVPVLRALVAAGKQNNHGMSICIPKDTERQG